MGIIASEGPELYFMVSIAARTSIWDERALLDTGLFECLKITTTSMLYIDYTICDVQ